MKTPQQTHCYDSTVLGRLLAEQLQGAEETDVLAHIETCESCRNDLGRLAGDHELEPEIRAHFAEESISGPGEATVLEGESQEADIEQIKALLGPTDDPHMLGRIGHYEVNAIVGRGSTGVVFKALDNRLNRFVAIKMLAPSYSSSGSARRRFEREARSIAAVRDEHVIPVFAVDEHMGLPFIVMEYMPAGSLAQRIEANGSLETCEVVRIGMQIARALQAAHGQGIVHRDVKPANVLLETGIDRALVTDFGLARVLDEASMTRSGAISGTPQFMSPEQASGEAVDHRSDLFSLGSVMYMACTGHSAFRSETVFGVIKRVCETAPRPIRETNPSIKKWLCDFIEKLHAKDADERFQSAKEVADFLAAELAHLQSPTSVPKPVRTWRPVSASASKRPKRIPKTAVVVAVVAAALWGVSRLNQIGSGDETTSAENSYASTSSPDQPQPPIQLKGSLPTSIPEPDESVGSSLKASRQVGDRVSRARTTAEQAVFTRALKAFDNKEYDEAIKQFKLAISNGESTGKAEYNIACSYALTGRPDDAFPWLEKAYQSGFSNYARYRADSDLKSLRKSQRFKELVDRMKRTEHAEMLTNRGIRLHDQGRYEEAIEVYSQALEECPDHPRTVLQYGTSLHFKGDLDKALVWHLRTAESSEFDHYGNYNIACYYSLKGDKDRAFEYFRKAIDAGMLEIRHFEQDSDLDPIRSDERYQKMLELAEAELRKNWSEDDRTCFRMITAIQNEDHDKLNLLLQEFSPDCSCPGYQQPCELSPPGRRTPLSVACEVGNLEAVKILVEAGADSQFMPGCELRPLMIAVKAEHTEVARYLLNNGAQIDHSLPGVGTALCVAASNGKLESTRLLLDSGASTDCPSDGIGTPLACAVSCQEPKVVKLLLARGANPIATVPGQKSAMALAKDCEDQEIQSLFRDL